MVFVAEADVGPEFQLALPLDVDLVWPVDHDLGHVRVGAQVLHDLVRRDEHLRREGLPPGDQAGQALGPDAGWHVAAQHFARGLVNPDLVESKDLPQDELASFQPVNLGDGGDPARAVGQPVLLDDEVDGPGDLVADGRRGQFGAGPHHHRLQPRQGVVGRVGVDGGQRAIVAGVHRLQHVQRLGAAHLADDDAVGAHAQGVAHQLANSDLALAFHVGRPGFLAQRVGMDLVELQFGRVFDGDRPLSAGDKATHHIQRRRLARTGAARDEDVQPGDDAGPQKVGHLFGQRTKADQVFHVQRDFAEAADGDGRPVERQGGDDGVDAAAVWQAGVHHGAALVNAPADGRDDAVDDVADVLPVHKDDVVAAVDAPASLDKDFAGSIDHDLGDRGVVEQHLQRAIAGRLVGDEGDQSRPVGVGDDAPFLADHGSHQALHLGSQHVRRQG